ncbi:MAG: hypothetical protein K2Z81_24340 [Cyanobacteria bacterium]|nr:hypothetical protein [Cyanobacteriota bacterium]
MARLISDDQEYASYIDLSPVQSIDKDNTEPELWQSYVLQIAHGDTLFSIPGESRTSEACVLCRRPKDEIVHLAKILSELVEHQRDASQFEPLEPSFELRVERQSEDGYRVFMWLDKGNVETEIYRWDSLGIRFFTSGDNLQRFTLELLEQFA